MSGEASSGCSPTAFSVAPTPCRPRMSFSTQPGPASSLTQPSKVSRAPSRNCPRPLEPIAGESSIGFSRTYRGPCTTWKRCTGRTCSRALDVAGSPSGPAAGLAAAFCAPSASRSRPCAYERRPSIVASAMVSRPMTSSLLPSSLLPSPRRSSSRLASVRTCSLSSFSPTAFSSSASACGSAAWRKRAMGSWVSTALDCRRRTALAKTRPRRTQSTFAGAPSVVTKSRTSYSEPGAPSSSACSTILQLLPSALPSGPCTPVPSSPG
mmetsp:Transcript_6817/g.17397  ORF Transcript_6817/g.17397 Transcript_6817/m.17397 type:complete len:266 (-) Transcript_6817:996-1793(-)